MKRIFLFIVAAIATVFGSIGLWPGVASAHQPVIGGSPTCMNNGSWTVHWTVGNTETDPTHIMTFTSAQVNGASISLSPDHVPAAGSATATSTHSSATASATLVVNAHWSDGFDASDQFTVEKPGQCLVPTTTTTTVAATTTTTTVAATTTTTTAAPTTTTVPAATTTVQLDATTVVGTPTSQPPVTPAPQVAAAQVSAAAISNTLPTTGTTSVPLVLGGAALLLVGVGLVLVARRRGAPL